MIIIPSIAEWIWANFRFRTQISCPDLSQRVQCNVVDFCFMYPNLCLPMYVATSMIGRYMYSPYIYMRVQSTSVGISLSIYKISCQISETCKHFQYSPGRDPSFCAQNIPSPERNEGLCCLFFHLK